MMQREFPQQSDPNAPRAPTVRVVHIELQPKSWFGRVVAGVLGIAALGLILVFSVIAFVVLGVLLTGAFVYFFWVSRKARRAMREDVIEGEIRGRKVE
jgi:hypothetical protein